jgi:hypothetical protein
LAVSTNPTNSRCGLASVKSDGWFGRQARQSPARHAQEISQFTKLRGAARLTQRSYSCSSGLIGLLFGELPGGDLERRRCWVQMERLSGRRLQRQLSRGVWEGAELPQCSGLHQEWST